MFQNAAVEMFQWANDCVNCVMRANYWRWVQVWRAWRSRRQTRCSRRRTRTATGSSPSRRSSRGPTSGWAVRPAGITTTRITTTTAASSFTTSTRANTRPLLRGRSSDPARRSQISPLARFSFSRHSIIWISFSVSDSVLFLYDLHLLMQVSSCMLLHALEITLPLPYPLAISLLH